MQDLSSLSASAYTTPIRIPKYNGAFTVRGAVTPSHGARILRRLVDVSRDEHRRLAIMHAVKAEAHRRRWGKALEAAAIKTFGRPFRFGDYRISAIGLDVFPEREKDLARRHAHASSAHWRIAYAHAWAVSPRSFQRLLDAAMAR